MHCKQVFENGTAVIPFLTCGYPDLETSEKLIYALAEASSDMIMLGIPFSDPSGEGPVQRKASEAALRGGVNTDHIFELLGRVRQRTDIPVALKTYANIVFAYGTERFVRTAAGHKVNALILPDVPYGEKEEFKGVCDAHGIQFISFVAPAPRARIAQIAGQAQGFIYLGGMGTEEFLGTVQALTSLPVVVPDFGDGTNAMADGIVLESKIMEIVDLHGKDSPQAVLDYTKNVVASLKRHSHLKKRIATTMQTTMTAVKIANSNP